MSVASQDAMASQPSKVSSTDVLGQPTSAWAFSFSNDAVLFGIDDKDFTFGFNFSYTGTGTEASNLLFSPYRIQSYLDYWLAEGEEDIGALTTQHGLELGLYGFTPYSTFDDQPLFDDRPYSSLVYAESMREDVDIVNGKSWSASLSVGLLGLNAVSKIQNFTHSLANRYEVNGWDNQISQGGELTARYTVAREIYHPVQSRDVEWKTTHSVSLGYLTEAMYSASFRFGKFRSGWWTFDPGRTSYGENVNTIVTTSRVSEHYFWGGAAVKARAYNVFLQGQFRDSVVTFDFNDLNHFLVEVWLGHTVGLGNGYHGSYFLRGQTSEIQQGTGDRHLLWGGLVFGKSY